MSRTSKNKRKVWFLEQNKINRKTDFLVTEEPLEIELRAGQDTQTAALTMRTPGNDFELAAGFLYNEGVINRKHNIAHIRYCIDTELEQQAYNFLSVRLRAPSLPELPQLDRHFYINSACGLCGKTTLDALQARKPDPIPSGPLIEPDLLYALPDRLRKGQSLFERTGGLHAAALFDTKGKLLAVREDIGRHNAFDKLVGWGLMNNQLPFHNHIILVSARASFELLQKALFAGVPVFCAVSAPSSLAVSLAERFNITLVGFLRGERCNVYTGRERIRLPK